MSQITFDQLVALVGMATAVITVLMSVWAANRDGDEREQASVAKQQMLCDKLDGIARTVSETRDDVRELRRMIDGHGRDIARLSQDVDGLRSRVKHIEIRVDDMQVP